MKKALSVLLILALLLQPLAALAEGDGGGGDDGDRGSPQVQEHVPQDQAEHEGNDFAHDGEENGDDGTHASPDGNGGMHLEYTDDKGTHQMDITREVQVVASGENGYAIQGNTFTISVRTIPPAREADVRPPTELHYDTPDHTEAPDQKGAHTQAGGAQGVGQAPAPQATPESPFKSQQGGFNDDLGKLRDFGAHFNDAKPERDEKDVPSRAALELEEARLRAAAETGAQITSDLLGQLDQANSRIDQAQNEFAPPAPETLINAGPEFTPPTAMPADPSSARTRDVGRLERVAQDQARQTALSAVDQAITGGLIDEIGSAISPAFTRIGAFIDAHHAALRMTAEFGVNMALVGFPVVNAAWGMANLASAAVQGTTILGTPVENGWDVAFIALGAILPGESAKGMAELIEKGSAEFGDAVIIANADAERLAHNPLNSTVRTERVLEKIDQDPFHGFPDIIDNFAGLGEKNAIIGGDAKSYVEITLEGSYGNKVGHFEWIIDQESNVTHRLFRPRKD